MHYLMYFLIYLCHDNWRSFQNRLVSLRSGIAGTFAKQKCGVGLNVHSMHGGLRLF